MESVEFTFSLHPDMHLALPCADTPAGWITFGLHENLDEAALLALDGMVDLLGALHSLDRHQALGMASVLVDLHVTQLVNQIKGVHAMLPHGAFWSGPKQALDSANQGSVD
jgi:acetamidase/formamidase